MLISMTGFGTITATIPLEDATALNVQITVKALNSRFFEAQCRLPHVLSHLEIPIIKILKKKLLRGQVYCTININNMHVFKNAPQPSLDLIKHYFTSIETIKKTVPLAGTLSIADLVRLPDVFTSDDKRVDETFEKYFFDTLHKLAENVHATRVQEGRELYNDISFHMTTMEELINKIAERSNALIEEHKQKIADHLAEVEQNPLQNDERDARAITLYTQLDKMDINEEIVRFQSHLKHLKKHIESSAREKGKRIDFTLQELGRETNTIAAKCADATISTHAVSIKVALEKSREQAQNIV